MSDWEYIHKHDGWCWEIVFQTQSNWTIIKRIYDNGGIYNKIIHPNGNRWDECILSWCSTCGDKLYCCICECHIPCNCACDICNQII